MNKNKIILLGNYTLDKQESMQRFCDMLADGFLKKDLQVEVWKPKVIFGHFFKTTQSGVAKWFGYLDKWLLYPIILKIELNKIKYKSNGVRFHICDHSNAPYLRYLPQDRTAITCHDVLAIRGAMGYKDAYAPASKTGKIYQSWILKSLKQAKLLAAVSNFSLNQLKALSNNSNHKDWMVIHNAFNAPFFPMEKKEVNALIAEFGLSENDNYILHVGTSHIRKNRNFLLYVLKELENKWNGKICFAGMPIDATMDNLIDELNLRHRILSAIKPSHKHLVALYNGAEAFAFPSLSEGFGWPVIEAQACGTPVLASDIEPMPEVSGGTAIHANPKEPKAFADAFLSLLNQDTRHKVIKEGLKNIERFQVDEMIDKYLEMHNILK